MSVDIDVINSTFTIIGLTIAICTRSRCGLTSTRQLVAAAIAVHDAAAFGNFLESVRVARDIVRVAIFADEFSFFLSCQVNGFTIDLGLVFSRNGQSRLRLEDVLVRIFRLSIRLEAVAALRAGVPAGCRLAVEVCAEIVAVWRCGVDFPVAAFAGLDGFLCRGQVLEGTICTACIDDNGIVFRRLSVQCTIIIGVLQDDCTVFTRRRQVDLFASLDAIDIDVARSLDINTIIDGGNAVAYGDVCSMNRNTFIRTNLTSVRSASSRSSATNGHVASRIDCEVFQAHRQSSIALQIHLTAASLYFKTRMSQILLLDKSLCRSGRSGNIVPVRSDTITYCYIWTAVIRLCRRGMRSLRVSFMPFSIIVLQWSTAVICKLRAFAAGGLTFRSSNPIITIAMFGICRIDRITTAFTAYEERNLTSRCCKRILKRRSNRCQIRIVYSRTATSTILSQPFRRFPRIRNTVGHVGLVSCR